MTTLAELKALETEFCGIERTLTSKDRMVWLDRLTEVAEQFAQQYKDHAICFHNGYGAIESGKVCGHGQVGCINYYPILPYGIDYYHIGTVMAHRIISVTQTTH